MPTVAVNSADAQQVQRLGRLVGRQEDEERHVGGRPRRTQTASARANRGPGRPLRACGPAAAQQIVERRSPATRSSRSVWASSSAGLALVGDRSRHRTCAGWRIASPRRPSRRDPPDQLLGDSSGTKIETASGIMASARHQCRCRSQAGVELLRWRHPASWEAELPVAASAGETAGGGGGSRGWGSWCDRGRRRAAAAGAGAEPVRAGRGAGGGRNDRHAADGEPPAALPRPGCSPLRRLGTAWDGNRDRRLADWAGHLLPRASSGALKALAATTADNWNRHGTPRQSDGTRRGRYYG